MEHRWLTIGATVLIFALGLLGMTRVQQQFFPDSSRPEIMVDVWFPEGTALAANEAVVQDMEGVFRTLAGVQSVTAWVGSGVPRFYLPLDQVFPQPNVSQFILLTDGIAQCKALQEQLPPLLAEKFPQVRARVKLLSNGPPVPYPVQFRVLGPDPQQLRTLGDTVKQALRAHPDMRGVNDNWNEAVKAVQLEIDQTKARALGVSSQSIAQASKILFSGTTVGQYREGDKLIDIVLRQPRQEGNQIGAVEQAYVPTASGQAIPLTQIAQPQLAWEPGVLWRQGREYAITVQGDVRAGIQGATVTKALLPQLRALEHSLQE